MILYEADNHYRQIYTDGRKLPEDFNLPAFYGYSAAHWEGVTRVVAKAGFNDKTRSMPGATRTAPPCAPLERFRRRDFGHRTTKTFDDPQTYTKPFTLKIL